MQPFNSYSRFLITGTPLQNDLKELWSLLHFLLPTVFTEWELFEAYFDFSDLKDEDTTEGFLAEKKTHEMISKIQLILQPLLLRRIKADVEHLLPKKREYILYAPMTKEQTEMCDVISDETRDTRDYLEEKVVERLTAAASNAPKKKSPVKKTPAKKTPAKQLKAEDSSEDDLPLAQMSLTKRGRGRPPKSAALNPFELMMKNGGTSRKRKNGGGSSPASKSSKSSRHSTPSGRTRNTRAAKSYSEAASEDEDALSDDEFEQKLAEEMADKDETPDTDADPEEAEAARIRDLASKYTRVS